MPQPVIGHLHAHRTNGLCHQRIHHEGIARIHDALPRPHQRAGRQLQHIVRAVAQRDPAGVDAVMRRQRLLQVMPVGIRIAGIAHRQHLLHGCHRLRRHAQRVFVGGQLDDPGRIQPQLARHLPDGTPRFVRRQPLHASRRPVCGRYALLMCRHSVIPPAAVSSPPGKRRSSTTPLPRSIHSTHRGPLRRIRPQQPEERRPILQLHQRLRHCRIILMPGQIDVEIVFPAALPCRARLEALHRHPVT